MTSVVVAPYNVASYPEAGGHFWVYLQYIAALKALGCDVYWLEQFHRSGDTAADSNKLSKFWERIEYFGLKKNTVLYYRNDGDPEYEFIHHGAEGPEKIIRQADLLLNFHYDIDPEFLSSFQRTALVDIDPGLLQFWVAHKQLELPPHDLYFTTGETVGTDRALFPDCGLQWIHIRPPVFLDLWPFTYDASCDTFTTVSSWWGEEYIYDGKELLYENNKRATFLEYTELPHKTDQVLELALSFGDDEEPERARLTEHGWRVIHANQVAGDPRAYRSYVQQSRGEFSCVKPSCIRFQNAWISDRSLCYLASGKPIVVQDTGPSDYLPGGEGLFRFSTMTQATEAIDEINRDYKKHCMAARGLAETHFDAIKTAETILSYAL